MGQESMPTIWSTHGGWRWKNVDSIKEKEYPEEGGSEEEEKNTVATKIRLVIK